MYHWIEDKEFLKEMKYSCSDIVNRLVQAINKEGKMKVRQYLVGSGAKDMILQNADEPVDLDYNLEIISCSEFNINDGNSIKMYIQRKFDEVLDRLDLGHCQDSSSVLSTHKFRLSKKHGKGSYPIGISIDICITYVDSGMLHRLIHGKHGMIQYDTFIWNEAGITSGLDNKVQWLKSRNHWKEVEDTYLKKKNMYLTRNDYNHPSFVVYIESVNEVYYKYVH